VPEVYGVAALLGSSQLHGICPGDFCDFSMANLNPLAGSMAAPSVNTKKLSQFRRKLSMMVVAESFADADEVDLDGGGDDAGADGGKKKKRGKRGPRSTSRTRAQDVAAELHKAALAGIAVNLDSDPSNPEKLISFRSILQVRRALLHSPHRTTPFLTSSVFMCCAVPRLGVCGVVLSGPARDAVGAHAVGSPQQRRQGRLRDGRKHRTHGRRRLRQVQSSPPLTALHRLPHPHG
jgi:hypothetical protein